MKVELFVLSIVIAYRASYFGASALVVGNSINLGTSFYFIHQSTYGLTNVNYASSIGQNGAVSVVVQNAYAAPVDWFLGFKGLFLLTMCTAMCICDVCAA